MNARLLLALGCLSTLVGCAHVGPTATLPRLDLGPGPVKDLFRTDTTSTLSEEQLQSILDAPVFLGDKSRVGVLQVSTHYALDTDNLVSGVPAELNQALEKSGLFDACTEVASDWPTDSGVAGLRELAARYRVSYLLLYRQRFAEKTWWNGWGWLAPTVVGALVAPNQTLASDGILEATLFDVRRGTLVFSAFERVHATRNDNVWNDDLKMEAMEKELAEQAAAKLSEQVVDKARRLAALRPTS
jgi:hypothetical protein